ncbi:MAG: hypothetical protein CSA24_00350 [Deltaproteobacteria bacterium]|nr:MAG: hypothetical protein CSB49_03050 [Pseudomonadota bacterium]PIE66346.1 MAG: hypothetical protein CSA24_00350 [Deltaproteobacteria bacterium]
MKITCDNCAAKYSIADEKVRGKVFKIRCKKCSNIIVVRGTADEAHDQGGADAGYSVAGAGGDGYGAAAAYDGGVGTDEAVWHVVVGRDQVGPMTASEVRDRFASGEINADSYIWREGFGDWARLTSVDEFADIGQATAVAGGQGAAVAGGQGAAVAGGQGAAVAGGQGAAVAGGQGAAVAGGQGAAVAGGQGAAVEGAAPAPSTAAWGDSASNEPGWGAGGDAETQRADSASLFGADGGVAADPGAGGGDLFGGGAGQPDPYATQEPQGGGIFSSADDAVANNGGGDLFGGGGGASAGAGLFAEDAREQIPSDPSVPVQQMTGQRGENSVLFSLANLQALATGGDKASGAPSAAPTASAPKPGMASGGGSGLIDIRAMAATVSTASADPGSASKSDDPLPAMGGFGGPIAAAPVLMPTGGSERPGWLVPTLIGGGVLVLGLAITLVVLLFKTDRQPTGPGRTVASAGVGKTSEKAADTDPLKVAKAGGGKPAGDKPAGDKPASDKPASDKPAGDKPAGDSPASGKGTGPASGKGKGNGDSKKASKRSGRAKRRRGKGRRRKGSTKKSTSPPRKATTPAPTKRKKHRGGKRDELDLLLDGAMSGKKRRRKTVVKKAAPAPTNLPDRLGRSQIVAGMRKVKPRVRGCFDRFRVPGLAMVKVSVGASGKVTRAKVTGIFGGTPTGACVSRVVKSARFSPCKSITTFDYPFNLR